MRPPGEALTLGERLAALQLQAGAPVRLPSLSLSGPCATQVLQQVVHGCAAVCQPRP